MTPLKSWRAPFFENQSNTTTTHLFYIHHSLSSPYRTQLFRSCLAPPTLKSILNPTSQTDQTVTMSFQKPEKDFGEGPKVHKIRITLTSRKVQSLEKVCTELLERAKSKNLRVKGPVRLPTKVLKVRKNRKTQKPAAAFGLVQRATRKQKRKTEY
jgi:ribosomal protein S10